MHTHIMLLESVLIDRKIFFATTFWDRIDGNSEGIEREDQLKTRFQIFQPGIIIHVGRDSDGSLLKGLWQPSLLVSDLLRQPSFDSQKGESMQLGRFVEAERHTEPEVDHFGSRNRNIINFLLSCISDPV